MTITLETTARFRKEATKGFDKAEAVTRGVESDDFDGWQIALRNAHKALGALELLNHLEAIIKQEER